MTKGQVEYAVRKAHENYDKWNDVTDVTPKFSSYYYEMLSVIEDCVRIGAKIACNLPLEYNEDGDLKK